MKNKVVKLNETEQRLVKFQAKARLEYDRKIGAHATLYSRAEPSKNEIDSYGAEIAYCKLYNCYPDLRFDHFSPFDVTRADGTTVDVKWTNREKGRLLIKAIKRETYPDEYALMIGEFPEYRLAGHIKARDAIKEELKDKNLPVPAYAINQELLS